MNINCLIVDDEQLARDMLEAYAKRIPFLNIIGKCKSPVEAMSSLKKQQVDLILLDINMPKMSGVDFIKQLPERPLIIFTTAYSEYTLVGFELQVVDYLLKPIGFNRFQKAIQRAFTLLSNANKARAFDSNQTFEQEYLLVKEGYNHHQVFLKDIIYVMAMREYVQYHTTSGKIMELKSISSIEKVLPAEYFIRIHRSYIVARPFVKGHEQNALLLNNNISLPLGKTYKQKVLTILF